MADDIPPIFTPCFFCKQPYHPATGSVYLTSFKGQEKITPCCRNCTRESNRYVAGWTSKGVGKKHVKTKESFYEAAANQFSSTISQGKAKVSS